MPRRCHSETDVGLIYDNFSSTGVQYQKPSRDPQHGIVAVLPFPSATFAADQGPYAARPATRPTGSWDRCLGEPLPGTGLTAMRMAKRSRSPSLLSSLIGHNDLPSLQLSGRMIRMYPQLWGTLPPSIILSMSHGYHPRCRAGVLWYRGNFSFSPRRM